MYFYFTFKKIVGIYQKQVIVTNERFFYLNDVIKYKKNQFYPKLPKIIGITYLVYSNWRSFGCDRSESDFFKYEISIF